MFVEAIVSAELCERGCSERPPIRGIDLPIAKDETGTRRSDPLIEQRDPPIKCKCTQRSLSIPTVSAGRRYDLKLMNFMMRVLWYRRPADTKVIYWNSNMMTMMEINYDDTSLVSAARRYHSPAIRIIQQSLPYRRSADTDATRFIW